MMMGLAIAVCGVICLIAGYAVEEWASEPENVDGDVESSAAITEDLAADDYDWAGQKIHDLDAA